MSESHHQRATVELALLMPGIRDTIYSVPNGAHLAGTPKQKAAQMAKLKAEGLRPGVSDLVIPEPILFRELMSGESLGLYLEMKNEPGKRSTTSKEQIEWGQKMRGRGYEFEVAYGVDNAKEILNDYAHRLHYAANLKAAKDYTGEEVADFMKDYINDNPAAMEAVWDLMGKWTQKVNGDRK